MSFAARAVKPGMRRKRAPAWARLPRGNLSDVEGIGSR